MKGSSNPISPGDGDGGVSSPCLGDSMSTWLLKPETIAAAGVMNGSHFINLDNGHGFNYTTNRAFVGDVYEMANQKGMRVLLYEGDVDACGLGTFPAEDQMVPLFDSMLTKTQPWRPWSVDSVPDILGGYAINWAGGRFQFASIRGAGHMSPLNRPAASFTLIDAFTHEKSLTPVGTKQLKKQQVHAAKSKAKHIVAKS